MSASHASPPAFSLSKLTKEFMGRVALKEINLEIPQGAVWGLVGSNGAGKSTLLKIMAHISTPTYGSSLTMGLNSKDLRGAHGQKQGLDQKHPRLVGLCPEDPPLYRDLLVKDYLYYVAQLFCKKDKATTLREVERVQRIFALDTFSHRLIKNLSKGMKQKVALAQSLLWDPPILLWDEPTQGLDPKAMNELLTLVAQWKGKKTVVFSTHHLSELDALADFVSVMYKGLVIESGTLEEITRKYRPNPVVEAQLLHFNDKLKAQLTEIDYIDGLDQLSDNKLRIRLKKNRGKKNPKGRASLSKDILDRGGEILSLKDVEWDMNEVFFQTLELQGRTQREDF